MKFTKNERNTPQNFGSVLKTFPRETFDSALKTFPRETTVLSAYVYKVKKKHKYIPLCKIMKNKFNLWTGRNNNDQNTNIMQQK